MFSPRLRALLCFFVLITSAFPSIALAIGDNMTGDNLEGRRQVQEIQRQDAAQEAARNLQHTAPSAAPEVTLFAPQLSVPIPGIELTPPTPEGDQISVPFLAQYISGVYSYMLGISTIVAIVIVIAGGFYYLLGATVGDTMKGQALIRDAVAGLVVLYASYFILYTINPNLVSLRPLKLLRIQSIPLGEASGIDAVPESAASNSVSCPLRYNQGAGPWAQLRYGDSRDILSSGSSMLGACASAADSNGTSCLSTFAQSACGVTSLAAVLGFYGLEIAIPSRVPAPGNAMHRIDPIDTGIYTVLNGGRQVNNGPGPTQTFFGKITEYFPQFNHETVQGTAVLQKLREGKPVLIACRAVHLYSDDAASEPVIGRRGIADLYPNGHFMVLSGVVNDQILRIHDVGNGHSKTIRYQDFQAHCSNGSGHLIAPKPNAPTEVSATWGTGAGRVTVQMRLNTQSDSRSCAESGSASAPRSSASGEIERVVFNYQPAGSSPDAWPANSAQILFPRRLRSEQNPRVHIFIYLHGNNNSNKTAETVFREGYLRLLYRSLESVAGSKNIMILTPHHLSRGNSYPRFNLNDFYNQALTAARTVIPNFTPIDMTVGAHSGATCEGLSAFRQALSWSSPPLRGVIAYDGCLGDVLRPNNFSVPSGVAFYLAPDIEGTGMGNDDPSDVQGSENRASIVQRIWRLGPISQPPACTSQAGTRVEVFAPQQNLQRQGGGELVSFVTHAGHTENVRAMTNIAFCALYRNNP